MVAASQDGFSFSIKSESQSAPRQADVVIEYTPQRAFSASVLLARYDCGGAVSLPFFSTSFTLSSFQSASVYCVPVGRDRSDMTAATLDVTTTRLTSGLASARLGDW